MDAPLKRTGINFQVKLLSLHINVLPSETSGSSTQYWKSLQHWRVPCDSHFSETKAAEWVHLLLDVRELTHGGASLKTSLFSLSTGWIFHTFWVWIVWLLTASGLKLEPFSASDSANSLLCMLPLLTKFITETISLSRLNLADTCKSC